MKKFMFLFLVCIIILGGCSGTKGPSTKNEESAGYMKISSKEAHTMMTVLANCIVLDVRTIEEYDDLHIKDALLIPVNEITERAEKEIPDKRTVILVHCRRGNRSVTAAAELVRLGYVNVYEFGGINDWPYETIKGNY